MVDQPTAEDLDDHLRKLYADDPLMSEVIETAIRQRTELAELKAWRERAVTQARRAISDMDRFRRLYDPEQPDIALVIDAALDERDALRARVTELELGLITLDRVADELGCTRVQLDLWFARQVVAERDTLRSLVADLAEHGTRHDLNPTMDCTSAETVYACMANYLRRIDTAIRNRAKALLPQKEGKSNG